MHKNPFDQLRLLDARDHFEASTATPALLALDPEYAFQAQWTTGKTAAELTQTAFQSAFPVFGDDVVALSLSIFALTTIFAWSYYGERFWQ